MEKRTGAADRLRDEIDHGRGGDKTDWSDPAAVPLGVDDEAAGTPPTEEQVRLARRTEIAGRPDDVSSGRPDRDPVTLLGSAPRLWLIGLVAALALAILLALSIS